MRDLPLHIARQEKQVVIIRASGSPVCNIQLHGSSTFCRHWDGSCDGYLAVGSMECGDARSQPPTENDAAKEGLRLLS